MSIFVLIALIGWIPLVLGVFCLCRPRTGVLFSLFGAWLFLPMAGFGPQGLPDFGKLNAGTLAAMLGVLIFDASRLNRLRFSAWDLPMLVLLVSPLISAILAGFGIYEGLSSVINTTGSFGLAYLLGRMYFVDPEGRRALAMAFFVAGLVYVPLCLYEIRMSPQLHRIVYGFTQHEFAQTYRLGGWRPMVFMQHGLAVGLFMAAASAVGVWLWATTPKRTLAGAPMGFWVILLLGTAVLCKSALAIALLLIALMALMLMRVTQWRAPIVLLALMPAAYMAGRLTNIIDSKAIIAFSEPMGGERTQGSLSVRMQSEDILLPLAMRHPIWGAGRWATLIEDNSGQRIDEADYGLRVIPDAFWLITVANRGIVGLAALVLVFLIPVLAATRLGPARASPGRGNLDPAIALAMVVTMHMADNLLNAMPSTLFWTIAGALTGLMVLPRQQMVPQPELSHVRRAWN